MNLIFAGPQGSGKGTQSVKISKKFNLCHISSGDILRNAKGNLKVKIDNIMNKGKLVPDNLIFKILKEKLLSKDCNRGFILDGFPRNINQAKALKKFIKIDKVVQIIISDKEALIRISGRRICMECGAIYNISHLKTKNVCNKCGGKLVVRKDDNVKSIKKRLQIYHKETEKIFTIFNSIKINGERPADIVFKEIVKKLE